MTLLEQYKLAKETVQQKNTIEKTLETMAAQDLRKISSEYYEKISNLEQERDAKIRAINTEKETKREALKKGTIDSNDVIHQIKDIMTMIDLVKSSPKKETPFVYYFSDRDTNGNYTPNKRKVAIEPVTTIMNDEYSLISLYIVPNGKPVNKYSLIIRGYSIFGNYLNTYSRGYVNKLNDENCPIRLTLKDDCVKSTLLEYANNPKNCMKILGELPQILAQYEENYKKALALLNEKEWQKAYIEYKMNYYEHEYSNGTQTPEYAALKKELKKLA